MDGKGWFKKVAVVLTVFVAAPCLASEKAGVLTLAQSVRLALERSPIVRAAKEAAKGAQAQRKEAFTAFLPKFSTAYSYTRLNTEPTVTSPGSTLALPPPIGTVSIPPTTYEVGTRDNYSFSIEARQTLFAGGAIRANYEASKASADIAVLEEEAASQEIVKEVKVAYFNILKAKWLQAVAKQSVERLEAHRNMAKGFFETGMIPRNDLLAAEVELANGRQALVRAENGLELAKSRLNMLLQRDINTTFEVEEILEDHQNELSLQECMAVAQEKRPEIRAAKLRVEQARSLLRVVEGEYYPAVSLVGSYGRYGDSPRLDGSAYKSQEDWHLMAVANWTFWEWGRTASRAEAGLSRQRQAENILQNVRDQVALEVKSAYLLWREALKQVGVSREAIEQAKENYRINQERYREQVGTATEVIDAQTLLAKANHDYYAALSEAKIHLANLKRAMGVGLAD